MALSPALADISVSNLARLAGYTIVGTMTITGWQDTDGEKKKGDSFEGCSYGRVIIFDNNKVLKCTGYSYLYAYRPSALILVKGTSFVMFVDNEQFEMRN